MNKSGNRITQIAMLIFKTVIFTALWITGVIALRACMIIPSAIEMASSRDLMDEIDGSTRWLFKHSEWVSSIVLIVWVTSSISVWVRYRGNYLVACIALIALSVGANQIASVALNPIKQDGNYIDLIYDPYLKQNG